MIQQILHLDGYHKIISQKEVVPTRMDCQIERYQEILDSATKELGKPDEEWME